MGIKKIKVSNFKSFKELEIDLNQFNVLVGANAAGKSSFIQIFDFIRDIIKSGLSNAISMQGGVEYLRNLNIIKLKSKIEQQKRKKKKRKWEKSS